MALSLHPALCTRVSHLSHYRERGIRLHSLLPHLLALVSNRRLARASPRLAHSQTRICPDLLNRRLHHSRRPFNRLLRPKRLWAILVSSALLLAALFCWWRFAEIQID